ncbi:MAG: GDSL-type esterase/lipase family protein [Streptomycetales bacterium]
MRRILVLGDSLCFHGPERPEVITHPGLFPNVLGRAIGAEVDVVARLGWTARDVWWALTRDPNVWGRLVPRADAVVIAVGGMDQLPASVPTWLRECIPYIRSGAVRRRVRAAYHRSHPWLVRITGGRMRMLPQRATDHYLTRVVQGLRYYRPGLPVAALTPAPYVGPLYPCLRGHAPAVAAARAWAARAEVALVDLDPVVGPALAAGECNPDGLHWSWEVHRQVGEALARLTRSAPGRAITSAVSDDA